MASASSRVTTAVSSGSNLPGAERFSDLVQRYALGVLRVQGAGGTGTGCLIGGNFLITNYHVIGTEEEAQRAKAKFWYISEESPDQESGTLKWKNLKVTRLFHSSENNKRFDITQPADSDHLDYAILTVEEDLYLETIKSSSLSLFHTAKPKEDDEVCIIHHPDAVDNESQVRSGRERSYGKIRDAINFTVCHDTAAIGGSSGGAIIDTQGRFIALHHQGEPGPDPTSRNRGYAVLTSKIVADLEKAGKLKVLKQRIADSRNALEKLKTAEWLSSLREYYKKIFEKITVFSISSKGSWERKPPADSLYTHLAMITEEESKEKSEALDSVEDGRLPTYETILRAKKEIAPEEIFSQKKLKGTSRKRAVIYGSAGIGKSTFVSYVTHAWAKGTLWQEFDAVFCVRLRKLNKGFYPCERGHTYKPYDILQKEHEALHLDFEELLTDRNFLNKTLLILDGYDELPSEAASLNGHLYPVFQELKKLFPNILITSRPGSVDFDQACEFEILGFNRKQIENYASAFFEQSESADQQKTKRLLLYLDRTPLAKSLSHIPINLTILCSLFDENEELFGAETLLTITQLYDKLVKQFYKVFLVKGGRLVKDVLATTRPDQNLKTTPLTTSLGKIAFTAMEKGRLYLDRDEAEKIAEKEGLEISQIEELGIYKFADGKGSFIHLTFQEFFAAKHIANLYLKDKKPEAQEILRKHKFNPQFKLVWRMVTGLLDGRKRGSELQDFFDDLFDEPKDLAIRNELNLVANCFEECSRREEIRQYGLFVEVCADYIRKMLNKDADFELLNGNTTLLHHGKIIEVIERRFETDQRKEMLNCIRKIAAVKQLVPQKIVIRFIGILKDPQPGSNAKNAAVDILGKVAKSGQVLPKEALDELIGILKDPQAGFDAKRPVAKALGEVAKSGQALPGEALEALIGILKDSQAGFDAKDAAADALREVAKSGQALAKEALDALIGIVKDPQASFDAKSCAVSALGEVAESGQALAKEAVDAFIGIVKDPQASFDAKSCAVSALRRVAKSGQALPKEAVDAFIGILKDPKVGSYAKMSAAGALGEVAKSGQALPKEALDAFIGILKDPKVGSYAKISVADTLGKVAESGQVLPQEALEALIGIHKDPQAGSGVKSCAVNALVEVAESGQALAKEAVDAFIGILKDPQVDFDAKRSAVWALREVAESGQELPKEALEALIGILKDLHADSSAKRSAAETLVEVAKSRQALPKEALKALIGIFKDPQADPYVKRSAADALRNVAKSGQELPKEALEALIGILKDPLADFDTKESAADALREVAESGQALPEEALDAFIGIHKDPQADSDAKRSVVGALEEVFRSNKAPEITKKMELPLIISFFNGSALVQKGNVLEIVDFKRGNISFNLGLGLQGREEMKEEVGGLGEPYKSLLEWREKLDEGSA